MSVKPAGPFTLWTDLGCEGWQFEDFPTLVDALEAQKFGSRWHISKPAVYVVNEAPRPVHVPGAVTTPPII